MADFLLKRFLKRIRSNVIAGILLFIPLFVSVFVLIKLFIWVDRALPGVMGMQWTPGIGVLVTLVIAYFAGLGAKNYMGRKIIAITNAIISSIPVLNKIYLAVQQIINAITLQNKKLFDRVVLVEFPKAKCYSIGFVTSTVNEKFSNRLGHRVLSIFVPTTPNPTSGYMLYFPEDEVVEIDLPVEVAIKIIMSAGVLTADSFTGKAAAPGTEIKKNWTKLYKDSSSLTAEPFKE
jgi:uncharacterized membrane protein